MTAQEANQETHRHIHHLASEHKEATDEVTIIKVCAVDYRMGNTFQVNHLAESVAKINGCRGKVLRMAVYAADPISDSNPNGDLGSFKLVFDS